MNWVTGLIAVLKALLDFLLGRQQARTETQDRQDGANELELDAHREANRLDDIADAARERVRSDDIFEKIRSDPNNRRRRRKSDPLS